MHVISVKSAQVQMVSIVRYYEHLFSFTSFFFIVANENLFAIFCFRFTGTPAIRSRYAKVTVLVPPDDPKIVKGNTSIDHMVTTEDREIELECISSGGKPAAEVSNERYTQKKRSDFLSQTPIIINLISDSFILRYEWNAIRFLGGTLKKE